MDTVKTFKDHTAHTNTFCMYRITNMCQVYTHDQQITAEVSNLWALSFKCLFLFCCFWQAPKHLGLLLSQTLHLLLHFRHLQHCPCHHHYQHHHQIIVTTTIITSITTINTGIVTITTIIITTTMIISETSTNVPLLSSSSPSPKPPPPSSSHQTHHYHCPHHHHPLLTHYTQDTFTLITTVHHLSAAFFGINGNVSDSLTLLRGRGSGGGGGGGESPLWLCQSICTVCEWVGTQTSLCDDFLWLQFLFFLFSYFYFDTLGYVFHPPPPPPPPPPEETTTKKQTQTCQKESIS